MHVVLVFCVTVVIALILQWKAFHDHFVCINLSKKSECMKAVQQVFIESSHVSLTGSHQKRLDVQAGWKGNLHGGRCEHQGHHQHWGRERFCIRVLAEHRREKSAEVHRQQSQDHQDLAAQSGRRGLQGRPRWAHPLRFLPAAARCSPVFAGGNVGEDGQSNLLRVRSV